MADFDENLENEICTLEQSINETEQLIQELIMKRDDQQDQLKKKIRKRDRISHSSNMIRNTLNIESSSMMSDSTSHALQNSAWSESFDWENKMQLMLKDVFKCNQGFRPQQREVINASLAGRDCFVVMRTGGGKSLCFQLPSMLQGGLTLVVSPLLSLIADQVNAMNLRCPGSAAALTSSTDRSTAASIYRCFKEGNDTQSPLRLVYVTPERVSKSKQLIAALEAADKAKRLTRFVIDEAHCCSSWGFDFRNDYGKLHVLKTIFPHVPLIALTATAPHQVSQDVKRILLLTNDECVSFRTASNRPNLFYEVLSKPSNDEEAVVKLVDWINKHGFGGNSCSPSSGIVYCYSRKEADTLASMLQFHGIRSGAYHAGCEEKDKEKVHRDWQEGSISVVTATIAFGLGIDKPDVRFVIHFCLPKSAEAYYQESGRAGRDGNPSRVCLFFNPADGIKMATLCHSDRAGIGPLRAMQGYAMNKHRCCRRRFLAKSLGDTDQEIASIKCSSCDICYDHGSSSSSSSRSRFDMTRETSVVLKVIQNQINRGKKVTFKQLIDEVFKLEKKREKELTKKKEGRLESHFILQDFAKCEWFCAYLFLEDIISEDYHYTAYSTIIYVKESNNAVAVRNGVIKVIITFPSHLSTGSCELNEKGFQKRAGKDEEEDEVIEIGSSSSDDDFEVPSRISAKGRKENKKRIKT